LTVFYEVGTAQPVTIPPFHTFVSGITQHGKTEALKTLIEWLNGQGFSILILDVKDKTLGEPDFAEFPHIPIYMEEVTEPRPLLGLLESSAKMPLRFQFTELIRACQGSKSLKEVRDKLAELIDADKVHPIRKDKAVVLKLFMDELIEEIARVKVSDRLELKVGGINVVGYANRGFSDAFKQIGVRADIRAIRHRYSKVFTFFDEAHIQVPEGYSSASKDWVVRTIKEGASSQQFLIIADQTIKEVDKNVITQCPVKVFGGQPGGELEAQRTLAYMPVKKSVTVNSIMQLPLGHFYVCTREWTKLCYARPLWLPEDVAKRVARGELEPDSEEVQAFKSHRVWHRASGVWEPAGPETVEEAQKEHDEFLLQGQVEDLERQLQRVKELARQVYG